MKLYLESIDHDAKAITVEHLPDYLNKNIQIAQGCLDTNLPGDFLAKYCFSRTIIHCVRFFSLDIFIPKTDAVDIRNFQCNY